MEDNSSNRSEGKEKLSMERVEDPLDVAEVEI